MVTSTHRIGGRIRKNKTQIMYLNSEIELLFKMMDNLSKNGEGLNPVTKRMYLMGIISEMIPIITDLEIISENISSELSAEDARLKSIDRIFKDIGVEGLRIPSLEPNNEESEHIIYHMTDLFPLDDEKFDFNVENVNKLNTGVRMLCSEVNVFYKDINYAVGKGLKKICGLIYDITEKKKNIQNELYENFWYKIESQDDDLYIEQAQNEYDTWKDKHDDCSIQLLKDKVTQEILKLLKTGVFNPDTTPTNRDIKNSIIKISAEALEPGMTIPEDIEVECARFSKYVSYKDDIINIDYATLGKYIYKHINDINDDQINALIYFNFILWPIHSDMVVLKPELKKYLSYYDEEENNSNENLEWASTVIMSCKGLLKSDVDENFLQEYIQDAFNEEKLHLNHKLSGQSKYTTICRMIGMLKETRRVFRTDIVDMDLAEALASIIELNKNTLRRYVNQKNNSTEINDWTTSFVREKLYYDVD